MSINRHNNTPTSPRSVDGNIGQNNQNISDLVTPLIRRLRTVNAQPEFSPITQSSPRDTSIVRNLNPEFAQAASRYNLRSRTQNPQATQRTIPTTLSEEFAHITQNARRQARSELGLDDDSIHSSSSLRSSSSRISNATPSDTTLSSDDNHSVQSNSSSNSTTSSHSSDGTIYPLDESPVTEFNTEPALFQASLSILEHLAVQQTHIGLNEEHYLGLSNDFGVMHRNATMTPEAITQRLNQLFENPITQQQHHFLTECQNILNNRNNPQT